MDYYNASPARSRVILGIPDSHHPHQDVEAMEVVHAISRYLQPDLTFFYGDQLDCSQFSRHAKRTFDQSLAGSWRHRDAETFLRDFAKLEHNTKATVYLEGNHEAWVKSHLIRTLGPDMALDVYEVYSPESFVRSKARKDFTWIDYDDGGQLNHYPLAPNLWVVHGWCHGKHAAHAHLMKSLSVSITYGHTHRIQSDTRRNPATDEPLHSWSPGCLANLVQNYTYHNGPTDWLHGVTLIYQSWVDPSNWTLDTIPIDRGYCVLPDGKEIYANG